MLNMYYQAFISVSRMNTNLIVELLYIVLIQPLSKTIQTLTNTIQSLNNTVETP